MTSGWHGAARVPREDRNYLLAGSATATILWPMDLTILPSIAKYKVGDVVLKLGRPHRVIGRFWSQKREHIVYDLLTLDEDHPRKDVKVGEGLITPMPKKEETWEGV